jgi:CRP-like cAMP-binding protein
LLNILTLRFRLLSTFNTDDRPNQLTAKLILSDKELLETLYLADGQILFHRGDPGDALYLIETGQLRIFTLDRDGKELHSTRCHRVNH